MRLSVCMCVCVGVCTTECERDREANPAHDTNKLQSIFLFENGEYRVFPLVEHLMRSALFL